MVDWSRRGPDLANWWTGWRWWSRSPWARPSSASPGDDRAPGTFPGRDARSGRRPLLASTSDVPPLPAGPRLQVVRRQDGPRVRPGRLGHRRAQRLGQVEPRRRDQLGARRTGCASAPGRSDGRRDLRGQPAAVGARDGGGPTRDRQLGRSDPGADDRDRDQPDDLPLRRQRVPDRRAGRPSPRRPGAAVRVRDRARPPHRRRSGTARGGADRSARGPAHLHRGSGRGGQAPQAQGARRAQARRARPGRAPAPGRPGRAAASAEAAAAAGRDGQAARDPHHGGRLHRGPSGGRAAARPLGRARPSQGRMGRGARPTHGSPRTTGRARRAGRACGRRTRPRSGLGPAGGGGVVRRGPERPSRPPSSSCAGRSTSSPRPVRCSPRRPTSVFGWPRSRRICGGSRRGSPRRRRSSRGAARELEAAECAFASAADARRDAEDERRRVAEEAAAHRAEMETFRRSLASHDRERSRLEESLEQVRERRTAGEAERESLAADVERLDASTAPLADRRS